MNIENIKNIENTDILNSDIIDLLFPYQADEICRKVRSYFMLNKESEKDHFDCCPKCGKEQESFKRGGYTYKKDGTRYKALYRCPSCNKRFIKDYGQLGFHSHLDKGCWNKIIKDTIDGVPLSETAADINRHTVTVFKNRHKLLNFIEQIEQEVKIKDVIELDEKYIHESHKGLIDAKINHENKTIDVTIHHEAYDRGLGHDKVCIITALQREKNSFVFSYNTARPSSENIEPLKKHIEDKSYIFTDGISVYEQMFKDKNCTYKELVDISSYDKVNHLNNVNSFHSRISEYNRKYRNVSSIYINRYNALYSLRQRYLGYDTKEIVLKLFTKLRKMKHFFYQKQINKDDLFCDSYVLKARENLLPAIEFMKLMKNGYTPIYTITH